MRCAFGVAALHMHDGDVGNKSGNGEEWLACDRALERVQVGIGLQQAATQGSTGWQKRHAQRGGLQGQRNGQVE